MPEVKDNNNGKIIRVHNELIIILEKLRKKIKEVTWDVMDENLTWQELTRILAKKINAKRIV